MLIKGEFIMSEILKGVDCTVEECKYHSAGNKCTAGNIVVNGKNSKTSCDTECQTFIPNSCE